MRALVRANATGAVLLDANATEEPAAGERASAGAGVVLRVSPHRRLLVADDRALELPALEKFPRGRVRIGLAPRQIDGGDVERRARDQRGALIVVDHVVGRRHDVGQRPDHGLVVVERAKWLHVGHGGGGP